MDDVTITMNDVIITMDVTITMDDFFFFAKSYTYQKYGIQHRYTIII